MLKQQVSELEKTNSKKIKKRIAIVGNMNVGKTTLFSHMCGKKTSSVNIPGNTISITSAKIKGSEITAFDTPGICSIFSANEDERVSRDILLSNNMKEDVRNIVLVADAKHLKRSIAITIQYAEYGLPMVLCINMIDESASRGIKINLEKLSEILGIDVCPTIAREGIGVSKLITALSDMKPANKLTDYPEWIEQFLSIVEKLLKTNDISPRAIGLLLLNNDKGIETYIESKFGIGMLDQLKDLAEEYSREEQIPSNIVLANLYNIKAEEIVNSVQRVTPPLTNPFITKFGDWCTQISTGVPIAFVILYILYLFVGKFGATFLVDTINGKLFEGFLIPLTTKLIEPIPIPLIRDLVVDPEFGILPTGVFLALGLVVPVLFCFYIAFGLLEDSGYLPRISILLDKILKIIGLNGKGVIPLVMGFSCVTMAILTTRLLDTEKEKNIASFLLFLTMPCAPLVAVMLIILDKMPMSATLTIFGIIFLQIFIAGFITNKILPGSRTPLFMEIPAMRIPKPLQVIKMSASKTYFFIKEALPVFITASFAVFMFQRMGGLEMVEQSVGPLLSKVMGLPEKCIQVFIKTMIRRESGAAELEHLSTVYTNLQIVVNLLVMTFISPCVNAIVVLFKERGVRVGSVIVFSVTVYAIIIGSIVNHTCRVFGITFT